MIKSKMVRGTMRLSLVAFLFPFLCEVNGEITYKDRVPHVRLDNSGGGILQGKVGHSRDGLLYDRFTGIKFAQVPERFAEAYLIENKWDGVKNADKMGPMCTQGPSAPTDKEKGITTIGQEDCLYLNVYVPQNAKSEGKGLPVMVWLYGGGFMWGDGYSYGPQFFMDEPVILVTFNYRLGVFGFLSTGDEVVPGNNGMKDSILALQWVQKNIKSFGGDAGKVTLFGESTGGSQTHYLYLSPKSKGLFRNVISQSGVALSSWAYFPNPRKTAVELAMYLKCPSSSSSPPEITSEEILTCFKNAPVEVLNQAQSKIIKSWPKGSPGFYFGPTAEPKTTKVTSLSPFLTESPYDLLTSDKPISDVPWITGITTDEGAAGMAGIVLINDDNMNDLDKNWNELAPLAFNYKDFVPTGSHQAVAEKIRQYYFGGEKISLKMRNEMRNLYSDFMFNYGTFKAVKESARRKEAPVYLYLYAHQGPVSIMGLSLPTPPEEMKKISHADELIFQFDLGHGQMAEVDSDAVSNLIEKGSEHEVFAKNLVKLWASIAINGVPNHTWGNNKPSEWKPLDWKDAENGILKYYKLDQNPITVEDPFKERMDFWEKLYEDYFEKIWKSAPDDFQTKKRSEL